MKKSIYVILFIAILIITIFVLVKHQGGKGGIEPTPDLTSTPYITTLKTEVLETDTPTPEITPTPTPKLPEGFVYVKDVIPSVHLDIRYYTENNFVGERVDGYKAPVAILTQEAAKALKQAWEELYEKGYNLVIYDGYRPKKAVEHFVRWSEDPEDTKTKEIYYPAFYKSYLIGRFISARSGHSRGSTIDLSLLDFEGNEVDMGGYFDLFDSLSYYENPKINDTQRANRKILRDAMVNAGFIPSNGEWWHFRLANEPYPDTYFDFDVE